ncbi:MAG TPA: acyltransferase [Acidimicrobiales bacterium]|nr:acyltransferase [Acidimicrobiales bacterium]
MDGVRAVAVVLVIAFHIGTLWGDGGGLFHGGFIGVDIFFVLSGFLITSLLVEERAKVGSVGFRKFYARRALRLFPALAGVLLAYLLYVWTTDASIKTTLQEILSVVFYVSNFAQTFFLKEMQKSGLTFTWSLAIEEQFYVVWPALLMFGLLRYAKTRQTVLVTIALGAVASMVIRIIVWHWGGGFPAAYMRPDCRADGLLIGAFCAFAWRWELVPRRWLNEVALLCAGAILALAVLVHLTGVMYDAGFTAVSLATGVIILAIAENRTSLLPVLEWQPLRWIGKVSYGLYLWHPLAIVIALRVFRAEGRVFVAFAAVGLTLLSTVASWHLIERPFLRLKSRVAAPVAH